MKSVWLAILLTLVTSLSSLAYNESKFPGKGTIADFNRAGELHNIATDLMGQSKNKEALSYFNKAIQIYPYSALYFYGRELAYVHMNDLKRSEQDFRKAIAMEPDYVGAYADLAGVLTSQGKYAEAEKTCRIALRYNPKDPLANINLGEAFLKSGKIAEGKKILIEAKKLPGAAKFASGVDALLRK